MTGGGGVCMVGAGGTGADGAGGGGAGAWKAGAAGAGMVAGGAPVTMPWPLVPEASVGWSTTGPAAPNGGLAAPAAA